MKRSPRRLSLPCAALLGSLLLPAATLSAQFTDPPRPAAYALEGVRVVRTDADVLEGVTLVVRGGLIESIGAEVAPPEDARLLEGDTLWVYPGLVDAEGGAELQEDEPEDGEDDVRLRPWDPTRAQQGFTPHRRAVDRLTGTGETVREERRGGVVAQAVHPEGGPAPGRGALLVHRPGADRPGALVLRPVLGPALSLEGAGRTYPSTLFGVIAFLRQRFIDAERHSRMLAAHAAARRGQTPPPWDPDYGVLHGAATGAAPVFFRADRAEDIRRVLALSDELGFRPVIVGGDEAWRVAGELRRRGVPVLVSLDFPEPERWDPDETPSEEGGAEPAPGAPPEARPEEAPPAEHAEAPPDEEEPLEPEVLREKRRFEELYGNAGRLAEAGIRFALTSGGGEADLLEGARTAVRYGLAEEDALRALTSSPAEILGVPWIARVERGFPATFVVADGPLLAEETRVLYTFVEGRLEEGRAPGEEPEEPPAVEMTGRWDFEFETVGGTVEATLTVEQSGATFTGTLETQFGEASVRDGIVSGREITFVIVFDFGGETTEIHATGTVRGESASGTATGPPEMGGSMEWSAERIAGPGGPESGRRGR